MPIHKRRQRDPSLAESAITVALCCLLALAVNGVVWWWMGGTAGLQFATGYLLEWSLSLDNVFVIAVIFRYFQVPKSQQYRILYWGILGAVLMRLAFILAGAALISRFQFILPLFGLLLIYSAFQLAWRSKEQIDPERNLVFRLARRWLPLAGTTGVAVERQSTAMVDYGGPFLVRQDGQLRITPPLLVLLIVESTDLVFALDSVPAIFGITQNTFIVFASNILAVLGLRALYFLLAGVLEQFRYLHYGLAAVLAFVGLKMVMESKLPFCAGREVMPTWGTLGVIAALIAAAFLSSILAGNKGIEN